MAFKGLLFLVPVALGGWYVAQGGAAAPAGADGARAETGSAPPRRSLEACRELEQRMLEGRPLLSRDEGGLATIRGVYAMHDELVRQGCNPGEANRAAGRAPELPTFLGMPLEPPRALR